MTSTAHALVGGAIAVHTQNPASAALYAFLAHFILDSIPHWDFGTNWRTRSKHHTGALAIGETLFGIGLSYMVYGHQTSFFIWMVAISMSLLPDWLETPWYIYYANAKKHGPSQNAGVLERFWYMFYKLPNVFHNKANLPLGLITQVVTVGFFMLLLK